MMVVRSSASCTGRLYPQKVFLVLIFTRGWGHPRAILRSDGNMSLKNPVKPPGIDAGTVRLVAQRLNHYATQVPSNKYWNTVLDNGFNKIRLVQRLADKPLASFVVSGVAYNSHSSVYKVLPFSVQQPSRVTTLAWEPSCCIISNSLSKSSFSRDEAPSFTVFTATRRVVPSWPLISSASAFRT
jgi:hypothetical protein